MTQKLSACTPAKDFTMLQSETIDRLRFPLAIAVIFIHMGPNVSALPECDFPVFSGPGIYNLVGLCLSHVMTQIAVPLFFLFSGFLFFHDFCGWKWSLYGNKIKKRIFSLVIPYLLWNLIAAIVLSLDTAVDWKNIFGNYYVYQSSWSNWLGYAPMTSLPANIQLWFLRDLIVVTLLTPAIYWFINKTRTWGICLLGFAYISQIWPNLPGFNITSIFFFSVGGYFAIMKKNLVIEFRRIETISYIAAIAFLIPTIIWDGLNTRIGEILFPLYIISGVVASFNLTSRLIGQKRIKTYPLLVKGSFFVYAIHTIFLLEGCKIMLDILLPGNSSILSLIKYLLGPFVIAAVSIAIYAILKKWMPWGVKWLTGNR